MSAIKERYIKAMRKMDPSINTVEQIRHELSLKQQAELPPGTIVEQVMVANLPGEWIKAANVPEGGKQVILYFHGGGLYCGDCATYRNLAAFISRASGVRVLLVEYRLAPEHKYPAANDDCLAAYRWLLENGIPAKDIIIGGDSAGGALTVMTLLSLRDAGAPLPAAAFMFSPWTDLVNFDGESYTSRAELDPVTHLKGSQMAASFYIDHLTVKPPILSPINQDLSGLPALFIQVGDHEALLSDSTRLAERAKKDGVDVTLEIWDNMWHVFQSLAAVLSEAKQAIDNVGRWVQKRFDTHTGSVIG
ncbi:Monoterpene epsilon-lactone hydrolase [Pelotomaculum schinkii]|uniref:Monoterpene epsilon-lactone hydrolase n=1 Tax=Pelotomaculum schinkii TaxID=78350 RepID=A0A4Y7RCD9_9FIRM|nr:MULTISPECIES: alpha/beta hydrolase [Pelotomaculum]TEB05987.1 Monoterpene epsilon-lactone hydrolase [Pelotomaculum schinkii]TEB12451.1 Monoterpene epsilon-lactone hydrolase [Pelotomaculum sp. FP]